METGHYGNLFLADNTHSPEDPNCKYLHGTEKISFLCDSAIGRFHCIYVRPRVLQLRIKYTEFKKFATKRNRNHPLIPTSSDIALLLLPLLLPLLLLLLLLLVLLLLLLLL